MRIAFVLPGGGVSGGVRCTVMSANGLISRGHTVRIVHQKTPVGSRDWLRDQWTGLFHAGAESWLNSFQGPMESFRDIRQCRFEPGELVIGAGSWACNQLNRVNQPDVRKVHYLHGENPWDRPFLKTAWQEPVPKIAVASYLVPLVQELCGQTVSAVVPNGVDTTEYFPSLDEESRTAVGTVFGGGRHKDPETILGVMERLAQDCPSVPRMSFGADVRPEALQGQHYVRLPTVRAARDIYSRSLVWFLASRSEGFPAPILEAMACGCAVVATDCGGPRDVIVDGENGFIVPAGDVDRMTERIRFLLNHPEVRSQMVANAWHTVEHFTWEHSVNLLEQALQSIEEGAPMLPDRYQPLEARDEACQLAGK